MEDFKKKKEPHNSRVNVNASRLITYYEHNANKERRRDKTADKPTADLTSPAIEVSFTMLPAAAASFR